MPLLLASSAAGSRTTTAAHSTRTLTPRAYAYRLTMHRWRSSAQWRAVDAIVTPESGWNPCRRYPSTTDCFYSGSNSCGIPQANPCPYAWRGRLAATWRAQVRWLLDYIGGRYGSPLGALAFRRLNGWY